MLRIASPVTSDPSWWFCVQDNIASRYIALLFTWYLAQMTHISLFALNEQRELELGDAL